MSHVQTSRWLELSPATLPPSIDESPELHDPYSELNIFLAQKIKEEITAGGIEKKWSVPIQEKLIEKISPEFKRRFPCYRLGVAALKKIWEKVAYFAAAFENQKEALTAEGKVNIRFLIRENLKNKQNFSFHPYLLAQQLALKITECLATYDGIRPVLRHITTLIWATQRHLIPPEQVNTPDEFDAWDKLILKCMLEALGKNPYLSQDALQTQVRRALHAPEPSYSLIDNPDQSPTETNPVAFQSLIASADWVEIEHKTTLWTMQGELALRLVHIEDSPLLQLLQDKENASLRDLLQTYLRRYPHLKHLAPQIAARIRILSRYIWYTLRSTPQQSTVSLFFQWHLKRLSGPHKIDQLEEICRQQLPLLPFDRKSLTEPQHETQQQKGKGEPLTHC